MGGVRTITATTIPHPAITGIATAGMTAATGTATTGMTADTATTVETDHADDGTGVDREKALSFQAGSALYPELAFPAGASRVRQRKERGMQIPYIVPAPATPNLRLPNLCYRHHGNPETYDYCQQLLADIKLILLHIRSGISKFFGFSYCHHG